MVRDTPNHRNQLEHHSKALLFLGMCDSENGYLFYNPETGRITQSRDAIFNETSTLDEPISHEYQSDFELDSESSSDTDDFVEFDAPEPPEIDVEDSNSSTDSIKIDLSSSSEEDKLSQERPDYAQEVLLKFLVSTLKILIHQWYLQNLTESYLL